MRIFVTGATGFVGQALVSELVAEGHNVIATVRKHSAELPVEVQQQLVTDLNELGGKNTLIDTLKNVDVFIHTAARVHIMEDHAADPLTEFRKMNVNATVELARQASKAGVKRFIFLSSIKVNGESTDQRDTFRETDLPAPEDAYGQSKLEAEQALFELSKATAMEVVVIRPPLIYGPGVKGNFARLLKLMHKRLPLPLGAVNNQRSLLALDNLVSAILLVAEHPEAANQTFLVADNEAVSTTQLLKNMAAAQGKKAWLLPIPVSWMKVAAKLIGKQSVADRLFGSLQIDTTKIQRQLAWRPVITMQQQLEKMFPDLDARSRLRENDG